MTRRKLILPPFHGRRMDGYGDMMTEVAGREVARWPVGEPFELWPRMQAITLEVIMRVVFGGSRGDAPAAPAQRSSSSPRGSTTPAPGRARGARPALDRRQPRLPARAGTASRTAVLEEVRRRRVEGADERATTSPRCSAQARYEDGSPLTDKDLGDELITLLSDGPTSTSLAWAFERLLRHPRSSARLREEVLAGEDDAYMDAVVKETLRLCPPVPVVVRRLREPMRLGGYSDPGRHDRRAVGLPDAPPRGRLSAMPAASCRSASSGRPRAPTRGSRSAAACVAAWPRASRCRR